MLLRGLEVGLQEVIEVEPRGLNPFSFTEKDMEDRCIPCLLPCGALCHLELSQQEHPPHRPDQVVVRWGTAPSWTVTSRNLG